MSAEYWLGVGPLLPSLFQPRRASLFTEPGRCAVPLESLPDDAPPPIEKGRRTRDLIPSRAWESAELFRRPRV